MNPLPDHQPRSDPPELEMCIPDEPRDVYDRVAANVVFLRNERGWTNARLAREANIDPDTVARMCAGRHTRLRTQIKVAKAFGFHTCYGESPAGHLRRRLPLSLANELHERHLLNAERDRLDALKQRLLDEASRLEQAPQGRPVGALVHTIQPAPRQARRQSFARRFWNWLRGGSAR